MNGSRLFVVGTLLAATLAGCAGNPAYTTLEGNDQVSLPTLRISKNVYTLGRADSSPVDYRTGVAVEFGAAEFHGSDSQSLSSGQARLSDTTFTAPQILENEFDLSYYELAARWRQFPGTATLGYEALLGLGYAKLDFAVSSSTQSATESISSVGLRFSVGGIWRMFPSTSLQARVTAFSGSTDLDSAARLELFLVQALGRNAALRLGYAVWQAEVERDSRSDIELDVSGPSMGLDLSF